MNDIHSFFADRIHNISAEVGSKAETISENDLIRSIDQTLTALRWMVDCLQSTSLGDEVSIVASEILKES